MRIILVVRIFSPAENMITVKSFLSSWLILTWESRCPYYKKIEFAFKSLYFYLLTKEYLSIDKRY